MKYTPFHQYQISKLALGTIQLGMDYGIANTSGAPSQKEVVEILDFARAQGINTFDTARTYGEAEKRLGAYFLDKAPQENLIITKFKYDWFPGITTEKAWERTKTSVIESLNSLNIKQIPLLMYHKGPNEPMEEVMRIVPTMVARLLDAGSIAHAGISLNYSADANELSDEAIFEAIQIPLNLFDQEILRNGTLLRLHKNEKMTFIRSVFLQGLFFREPDQLTGILGKAAPYLKTIRSIASDHQLSVSQLAFAFIRDLPEVNSLVIGAENKNQIESNIALMESPALSKELRMELSNLFADMPSILYKPGLWSVST